MHRKGEVSLDGGETLERNEPIMKKVATVLVRVRKQTGVRTQGALEVGTCKKSQ